MRRKLLAAIIRLTPQPINTFTYAQAIHNNFKGTYKITLFHNKQLQRAFLEFANISTWNAPLAVTLTLRQGIYLPGCYTSLTETDAQQNLRHFLKVLNRKVYGNRVRHGHKLNCIPVIEGSKQTRLHYHLCLEQAPNMTFEEFAILVVETWRATTWGYRQVDIQPCDGGWLGYIAKLQTKPSYGDSIDWTNFYSR